MKRTSAAALAAVLLCAGITACSGSDGTEVTTQHAETSASQQTQDISEPEDSSFVSTEESKPQTTTPPQTEQTTTAVDAEETVEVFGETSESGGQGIYSALIAEYDNEFLGLPQKDKVYIFSDKDSTAEIDGELCYAVSCYDEHEGTLYYMCDYFLTQDGGRVYRFYEAEGRYQLLPEQQSGFAGLDPTTQTPEEIFAAAIELYDMFNKPSLLCDRDVYFDVEGKGRYYLLLDERFDTMPELLDALSGYFSEPLVNAFMDSNQFRMGEDGRMYYYDCAWGSNIAYMGTQYELTTLTEDTAVFTGYSSFEFEAGIVEEMQHTYTAKKEYGVWRFVDFTDPEFFERSE